jgi:hypothetical protein
MQSRTCKRRRSELQGTCGTILPIFLNFQTFVIDEWCLTRLMIQILEESNDFLFTVFDLLGAYTCMLVSDVSFWPQGSSDLYDDLDAHVFRTWFSTLRHADIIHLNQRGMAASARSSQVIWRSDYGHVSIKWLRLASYTGKILPTTEQSSSCGLVEELERNTEAESSEQWRILGSLSSAPLMNLPTWAMCSSCMSNKTLYGPKSSRR